MKIKGRLSENDIEKMCRAAILELRRAGIDEKLCTSFSLTLEEILILYADKFGRDASVLMKCKKIRGDLVINIYTEGEMANVLQEESLILGRVLKNYSIDPLWSYKKGWNRICFVFSLYNTVIKNYAFSWKYMKRHIKLLTAAVTLQLISAVIGVFIPALSAIIIKQYVMHEVLRVLYIAAIILVSSLLKNFFQVFSNNNYNIVYTRVVSDLEKDIVDSVMKVETGCMDEKGSGIFIQRITGDTNKIASGFTNIADMFINIMNYTGILIAMFIIYPMIAFITVLMIAVQIIIESIRTKRLFKDDRIYRIHNESFTTLVGEMIKGHKDIKLLNNEKEFSDELSKKIKTSNEKKLLMQKKSWDMKLFRWETGEIFTFFFLVLLTYLIANDQIVPSVALVVYNYYSGIGPDAVKTIGNFMDCIADFNISNERIYALLTSPEFPKEHFGNFVLENVKGGISFESVDFSYRDRKTGEKGRKVIDDMSFEIHPGETIGFVGKSGCGKSTTFNLITKLYEADSGKILLDGMNIKDLTKDSIRGNITVVTQNPYIFKMSVRDNLKLIKADLSDEEMEKVCRLACLHDDIVRLPQGYDTMIGEGGVNLSGGQRQRLAIARAMLRKTPIILFDEATSALDNITQAKIQTAIENLSRDRTVIIIAHRLSTVINADRIFFIQDGKVFAQGEHNELIRNCQPYRELAIMDEEAEST